MISRISFLIAVLCGSLATAAQPQQIVVWKLDAGYYVVSGSQILAFPPEGPIVPPDDPVVPDDAAKLTSDLIKALPAADARHQNAIKLAGTLKLLADQVRQGKLPPEKIPEVYAPLMAYAVPDSDWKHIHTAILAGLKGCPTPAVCATTLEQYAAGAMSTVPNKADPKIVRGVSSDEVASAAEEYGFNWSELLKVLLPLLLALLEQWLSYAQAIMPLIC